MKKLFYMMMTFMIFFFFIAVGTLKAQSSVLSWNFEGNNVGDSFASIGWSASDCQAVVTDDPVASGNKVLQNKIHNYNAAPVLRYVLPAGKTLADFNSFTFKGYFAQGDVGYKDIVVEAFQTLPTGHFDPTASAKIGDFNRNQNGSTNWENITVNIANTSTFTDTVYIAFGISCAGKGSINATIADSTTIWYADSITMVPKVVTSSIFAASKNTIDFGSDTVGTAKKDSVMISNRGTDTLRVTGISSTNAFFTFSPSAFSIAPSDSAHLYVTFTPIDTSKQSGAIKLVDNAVTSPDSIIVKGKGLQGNIVIPILTNGSFESSAIGVVDTTAVKGWLIQVSNTVSPAPVFAIESDNVEDGNRALKVLVNATGTNAWDIQAVADSIRVVPGQTYLYSIWAKAATAGAQVNFTMGNYSFTEYSAIRPATLTAQWQKFTMQFTVNDGNTVIRGPIHLSNAVNVGNTIYIDNLQITQVVAPPVDSSKIWKGPAIATGQNKFLGGVPLEPPENNFSKYWNQVTPGNAGKWGSVAGAAADTTKWNWSVLDAQYNYAIANHLVYKHHNLIWGAQQPSWISSMDTATQRYWIETWIRKVGERYPKIDMVDVVNEAMFGHNQPDGQNGRANYINGLGGTGKTYWDWLINAFSLARKYLPNAKLLLNDYNIINDSSSTETYYQIVNLLKSRNLIDGIGVQGHSGEMQGTDTTLLIKNLNKLGSTGLPVYISELDLGTVSASAPADDNYQLQQYQKIFPILWRHPSVKGITLWGYIQGTMWDQTPTSYLVNSDGSARPALTWLAQFIKNNPTGVKTITSGLPSAYQLNQNYPNPFNPTTQIEYSIPKASIVTLKVYDILGREVQTLVSSKQAPGKYSVTFNASNLSSGVYFYQLTADSYKEMKKLVLIK